MYRLENFQKPIFSNLDFWICGRKKTVYVNILKTSPAHKINNKKITLTEDPTVVGIKLWF